MGRTRATRAERFAGLIVGWALVVASAACTHDMRIVEADERFAPGRLNRSVRVAIEAAAAEHDERMLVDFVQDALTRHSSVERVAVNGQAPPDFLPDFVVRVQPVTEYDASGLNYLITFPGFIVFTHAWNGFHYSADIDTAVVVTTPAGDELGRAQIPSSYALRHTSFTRGAVTSSGWYTPFSGGINLIIGFFMINYDEKATDPFLEDVRDRYGRMVADEVIRIASPHIVPAPPTPPAPLAPPTPPLEVSIEAEPEVEPQAEADPSAEQ